MAKVVISWDPSDPASDPGPRIDVIISNSADVIAAGRKLGLEYPRSPAMKALLDTGASVTVISRVFANYCKLFQTSAGGKITAIGQEHPCGEHAGSISFPGTGLKPFPSVRILSAEFVKQQYYACLIGRDILRNWLVTFDGRSKRVTIED